MTDVSQSSEAPASPELTLDPADWDEFRALAHRMGDDTIAHPPPPPHAPPELTLDPADWDEFRALAHRMVDDTIAHLSSLHEQPAWREMPDEVRQVGVA